MLRNFRGENFLFQEQYECFANNCCRHFSLPPVTFPLHPPLTPRGGKVDAFSKFLFCHSPLCPFPRNRDTPKHSTCPRHLGRGLKEGLLQRKKQERKYKKYDFDFQKSRLPRKKKEDILLQILRTMKKLHILVGGPAGTGIESITHSLALSFTREGLHAMTTSEYENRIRGGHCFSSVHVDEKPVLSHRMSFDAMIAMDKLSIEKHAHEIHDGGVIIYDNEKIKTVDDLYLPKEVVLAPVPMHRLAQEAGLILAANVVAVGALFALLGRADSAMKTVLKKIFNRKGEEIVNINWRALDAGYAYVQENISHRVPCTLKGDGKKRFLMSGNEAICLGCIKAGIKFLAAYPMTPGSTILTTLAKESRNYDIVVIHAEDEIAAVNMAIGAGHSGVRAATSTSGGGFALMGEAMSLAGQTETPVVIFVAQRPGPSTGLPTRTGQGDLRMAMHCGQGDFPRLVMAAGDHKECVHLAGEAFNYAERFQIPVVFLTDKYLADMYRTCERDIAESITIDRGKVGKDVQLHADLFTEDGRFKRFADSPDGVSVRAFPGTPGFEHTTTSYEHDETGHPTEEVPGEKPEYLTKVDTVIEKRWRKMKSLEEALPKPKVYGKGDTILFVWGSTKNPALRAQELLREKGKEVQVVQMQYIHPFKTEAVKEIVHGKKVIMIEGNQSGQLESVFVEHTGIHPFSSIRSYYGRPMTGQWICEEVEKVI